MTFSSNQSQNTNQLPVSLDINPDEPNFDSTLVLYLRRVANAVNTKQNGLFLLQETANFEQWYTATPQETRSAYRLTVDFVQLNGGPLTLPITTLTLTTSTQPPLINGYMFPVQGFGGCIDSTGVSYFTNDINITITYTASTNTFTIVNNTGNTLTWAVWVMEYLKN